MLKCPDIGSHREAGDGLDLRPPRAPASNRDSERASLAKTESTAGPRQTSRQPARSQHPGRPPWPPNPAARPRRHQKGSALRVPGRQAACDPGQAAVTIFPAKRLSPWPWAGLGLAPRPDTAGGARARWPDGGRGRPSNDVLPAPGGPRCRGAAPDGALSPAPRDPPVMPAAAPR